MSLTTNIKETIAEETLRAYKRQPIIKNRFSQLKMDFSVAPVCLRPVTQIEILLAVYFFVLILQTLLERDLRDSNHPCWAHLLRVMTRPSWRTIYAPIGLRYLGTDAPGKLVEDVVKLTTSVRDCPFLGNQAASCRSCAGKRIVYS